METKINPKTNKPYSRQALWRHKHPEKIEQFRSYNKTPEALFKAAVRGIKNREHIREVKRAYYQKNKERICEQKRKLRNSKITNANYKADHYIELKPCCEICGSTQNLERHHWNYDKPLLVNTLCITCHKIQHLKNFERWHKCKLILEGGIK